MTARHPNYKGGRIIEPRGYALVYVGKGHHLADVRGYAYEQTLPRDLIDLSGPAGARDNPRRDHR